MANFVGDAPSEETVSGALAGLGHRGSLNQSGSGTISDAYVISRRVHKRSGKHTHIADILTGSHGVTVVRQVGVGGNNPLYLVGREEHVFPSQNVLVHHLNHSIRVVASSLESGQHLVGGERQKDAGR